MAAPDLDYQGTCAAHIAVEKRLDELSAQGGALERGQRSTHLLIQNLGKKQDLVSESIGKISESWGEMVRHISEIDERLGGLNKIYMTMSDRVNDIGETFRHHKIACTETHKALDERIESLPDLGDGLDVDTGVYESMDGKEVKGLIAAERVEREKLQAQIDKMWHEAQIHQAEKAAVEQAKQQWQTQTTQAEAETTKLKSARYGMYGAIGVALITAAASITIAVVTALTS